MLAVQVAVGIVVAVCALAVLGVLLDILRTPIPRVSQGPLEPWEYHGIREVERQRGHGPRDAHNFYVWQKERAITALMRARPMGYGDARAQWMAAERQRLGVLLAPVGLQRVS